MIDSETPLTRVRTNFLPVQPVYTEPGKVCYRLELFAVQKFARFEGSRGNERQIRARFGPFKNFPGLV